MANVRISERAPAVIRSFSIADDGTTSGVIDKRGFPIMTLDITLSDAATLGFSVCDTSDGTFKTVKTFSGAASRVSASLSAAAHAIGADDLAFLAPFPFIKIVLGTAQTTGSAGATGKVYLMA